ncbi:MAG: hypothetical protein J6C96_05025 [Oscillospiraceae bacterium]|nr:hypothetical protein [Oscillospiraceae bacterium]
MDFFKKKCGFEKSLAVLGEKGFCEEYAEQLNRELGEAVRKQDIARGKSMLANALLILGRLSEAYAVFEDTEIKDLERALQGNLVGNMIFCKFVQDDFKTADELYRTYNAAVLGERSDVMKRSLAIHEHISGRYENSVEIIAKMLDSECRFLDICMVKSMLRLDMFERAAEFAAGFDRYKDCAQLSDEVSKLKSKVMGGLPSGKRTRKH